MGEWSYKADKQYVEAYILSNSHTGGQNYVSSYIITNNTLTTYSSMTINKGILSININPYDQALAWDGNYNGYCTCIKALTLNINKVNGSSFNVTKTATNNHSEMLTENIPSSDYLKYEFDMGSSTIYSFSVKMTGTSIRSSSSLYFTDSNTYNFNTTTITVNFNGTYTPSVNFVNYPSEVYGGEAHTIRVSADTDNGVSYKSVAITRYYKSSTDSKFTSTKLGEMTLNNGYYEYIDDIAENLIGGTIYYEVKYSYNGTYGNGSGTLGRDISRFHINVVKRPCNVNVIVNGVITQASSVAVIQNGTITTMDGALHPILNGVIT